MTCDRFYVPWRPLNDLRDVLSLYRRLLEGRSSVLQSRDFMCFLWLVILLICHIQMVFVRRYSIFLCEDLFNHERFFFYWKAFYMLLRALSVLRKSLKYLLFASFPKKYCDGFNKLWESSEMHGRSYEVFRMPLVLPDNCSFC